MMPRVAQGIGAVVAVAIGISISYAGTAFIQGASFGFSDRDLVGGSLLGLITISGVMASVLVSGLRQLPQRRRVALSTLTDMVLRPSALVAIACSPLPFFVTLALADIHSIGAASLLAAFQNGFFWEQIVKSSSPRREFKGT